MGEESRWDEVIYPGMKKALIHVLLVTQDEIEHKKVNIPTIISQFKKYNYQD